MTKKKKIETERLLTEVELELMNVVWELKRCSVREVLDALPKARALAYTSVATVMKILEEKGVLGSEKSEKTHVYTPRLSRETYEARTLKHVAEKLFSGNPSSMVMRLIDEAELSDEELRAIRKLVDERMR